MKRVLTAVLSGVLLMGALYYLPEGEVTIPRSEGMSGGSLWWGGEYWIVETAGGDMILKDTLGGDSPDAIAFCLLDQEPTSKKVHYRGFSLPILGINPRVARVVGCSDYYNFVS